MLRRLIANYTSPGAVVVNLTAGRRLTGIPHGSAALVVTVWPPTTRTTQTTSTMQAGRPARSGGSVGVRRRSLARHVSACAAVLRPGGCLAIVVDSTDIPDHLGPLVEAGRAAGLTYLQHLVVAHHLNRPTGTGDNPAASPDNHSDHPRLAGADADKPDSRRGRPGRCGPSRVRPRLRVHTDILILRAPSDPQLADGASTDTAGENAAGEGAAGENAAGEGADA